MRLIICLEIKLLNIIYNIYIDLENLCLESDRDNQSVNRSLDITN